ncbi:taste receptor type 1 member 1 [Sphaerodactylus townsendi]|uniref:taste receptor type 1 member 1 n=1 Tax=Sphaerodactylus townsendi TaxID=933632 RepID=UPI0020268C85|nr:taste receptor type 1 member 1 [Sphaerodactylus townsendi]
MDFQIVWDSAPLTPVIRKGDLYSTVCLFSPMECCYGVDYSRSCAFSIITTNILSCLVLACSTPLLQVSYEASSPMLSLKRAHPSFLRTIPSDRLQAEALMNLLKFFQWTWVVAVGSDNTYGRQGLQTLRELAIKEGICFAYHGIISMETSNPDLRVNVKELRVFNAKVAIVFANKRSARVFFQEVVWQNVTGKVWLGTEDWSLSQELWEIQGIRGIGTVIGVTIMHAPLPRLWEFEAASRRSESHGIEAKCSQSCSETCSQLCSQLHARNLQYLLNPSPYDTQGCFNVYSAVYAVAHSLHHLLDCQTGVCRKDTVYPWQLLKEIKKANFSVKGRQIYFDSNGDPLTGYDLVLWKWAGQNWSYDAIGSFSTNPPDLTIHKGKLQWHTSDNQVPVSICSKDCGVGEHKVQQGIHQCCFDCVACSPGTFLNRSDRYTCQRCQKDQWAPARSETCFPRATVFLDWGDRIAQVLLTATTLLLLLLAGTLAVFVRKVHTPVVRSAGGWLCFVMLSALACANVSMYCNFGPPSRYTCMLRLPMYTVSFNVCLACMAARSFQILLIFKMASKAPGLYEAWKNHHGCGIFIGVCTGLQVIMSLIFLCINPSFPNKNYDVADQMILLECKNHSNVTAVIGMVYNALLAIFCFVISYMGKDLPNSYNEAKCTTFSLVIYFVSLISYATIFSIYRGKYVPAIYVAFLLLTLYGVFGGYFIPKMYIILFRSELNTHEHFQISIQSYTKKKNVSD